MPKQPNTYLVPMSKGGYVAVPRAHADSGMVTAYRPAQNPPPSILQRALSPVIRLLQRLGNYPNRNTTESGSAGTAAPSVAQFALYSQRYERRHIIEECRTICLDDPRARRSVRYMAQESARGGVRISVKAQSPTETATDAKESIAGKGQTPKLTPKQQSAQDALDRVQNIVNKKLESWARMALTEGDIFIQIVLRGNQIVDLKRMPAASMERLTDDRDEFIDPLHAYEQVDVVTNQTIAQFPYLLVWHGRWSHEDGERYGTPELIAGRRFKRILDVTEEAQVIRRLTRAPKRNLWSIGTEDNAGDVRAIEAFKQENGFVEGKNEIFDPTTAALDYFGNGLTSVQEISPDNAISDIGDLEYLQNVYTSAALPTPPALIGIAQKDVNRDVLEDQRAEWLKQCKRLTELLDEGVRFACDLQLLLLGIPPETMKYDTTYSDSSINTPAEVIDRTAKLRSSTMGGSPDPLISKKTAMRNIAEYAGIMDVDAELAEIQAEQEQMDARQQKNEAAAAKTQAEAYASMTGKKDGEEGEKGNEKEGTAPPDPDAALKLDSLMPLKPSRFNGYSHRV